MKPRNNEKLRVKVKEIVESKCEDFAQFSDGTRMLILLTRKKDGGHAKEERRVLESKVTTSEDQFERALTELVVLKEVLYPNARIYLSVNKRNMNKVIRSIHTDLLNCLYGSVEETALTWKKLLRGQRHWVMKPQNKAESLFIIDVDDIDGSDVSGDAIKKLSELDVEIIKKYRTKNGWHIVTDPFNPALWPEELGEIKKDSLILVHY